MGLAPAGAGRATSAAPRASAASNGRSTGIRGRVVARPPTLPRLPFSVQLGIVLAVVGACTAAALALVGARGADGPALAVSAGLLWAGSDITIKALSGKTE